MEEDRENSRHLFAFQASKVNRARRLVCVDGGGSGNDATQTRKVLQRPQVAESNIWTYIASPTIKSTQNFNFMVENGKNDQH